ncbi:MAG: nuclease-related domain-containing protein [Nitrospira sp.]|nr:nuclease-related domain-containing protein [Nitrospira sp.]
MILKHKEQRTQDIHELNRLLTLNLSAKQRFLVEKEMKCLLSGDSGERNSAYHIDFFYKNLKDWMVIHDLRIEHRGLVAQIDHLLINRSLMAFVIESKNYYYGIKITDNGEFMLWNGNSYQGIESPIEQNNRHISLLQQVIEDRNIAPTRLGFPIPVTFKSYVIISPNARIDRPNLSDFDTSSVVKADALVSNIEKGFDNKWTVLGAFSKRVANDTLEEFGKKVVRLHRPGTFNYAAKFGINEAMSEVKAKLAASTVPARCATEQEEVSTIKPAKRCNRCGTSVDRKVVFYCNVNKPKFDGLLLCRECQKNILPSLMHSGS